MSVQREFGRVGGPGPGNRWGGAGSGQRNLHRAAALGRRAALGPIFLMRARGCNFGGTGRTRAGFRPCRSNRPSDRLCLITPRALRRIRTSTSHPARNSSGISFLKSLSAATRICFITSVPLPNQKQSHPGIRTDQGHRASLMPQSERETPSASSGGHVMNGAANGT